MKRLLSTFILCLVASTAALLAQQTYTLSLKTSPQGLATFRYGAGGPLGYAFNIEAGKRVTIYTGDKPGGWKITEWRVTEGFANISNSSNMNDATFTMPAQNLTLTAIMEYDPENPANPMPNGWYPNDGKLVLDYINGLSLKDAIRKLISNPEDYALVRTLIVGGSTGNIDLNTLNATDFPALNRVDLSRLENNNFSRLSNGQCANRPWTEVLLPVTIREIGRKAFEGTFLNELTVFATTPPQLSISYGQQDAFPSSPDIVYVPAEALPLYQVADGWRDFNLQPIVEEAANLKVSVQPADGNMSPYYGMTLEARNLKSLYTRCMIISNRQQYDFNSLPKHTSYDVRLLSRTGAVVAQATNVVLDEEDASVKLTSLRRPCELQLAVSKGSASLTPDQYTCLWLSTDGRVLMRGSKVDGILEDEPLQAVITLTDEALKATYRERDTLNITRPGDYQLSTVNYQLKPIPTHRLTTVVQRADGQFFGQQTATVAIHRTATGELIRQLQFNTLVSSGGLSSGEQEPLPEGEYEVTASVAGGNMSTVTQHLSLYGDQTLTFSLSEANGSTVNLKWTHYGVAAEGQTVSGMEKNPAEAAITLRDVTNWRFLTDFAITASGNLRLQEQLEPGTEVELTLGNRGNGQFAPAVMSAKVDADGNLSYNVVTRDYGTLRASFSTTECSRVSVRIYDEQGLLVRSGNAVSAVKDIDLLRDGRYTVVLMEGGTIADAMTTLDDLDRFLKQNTDYVSQQVSVSAGHTAVASFNTVPALSSNAHLYTDDAYTQVRPKKTAVTIGTYQTLTTQVVFRPEYKGRISQLNVVYTLPDDVNFIQGSPIIDNATTDYTLSGNQLTVPILEKRIMRFCVVPHSTGEYSIKARLTFLLDGVACEQPLPVGAFTVSGADIFVPPYTTNEQVLVSGTALPQVPVTVYVNDRNAGTTTSDINGQWRLNAALNATNNMDENSIYAQFEGADGYALKTATKTVVLDRYSIRPLKVRMSHFNEWKKENIPVEFDVVNNTVSPASYPFYHEAEFTFDVELSTRDSTNIDNVLLYVYMSGNQRRILFPKYNKETGTWVATDVFNSSGLPSQVRVVVEDHAPKVTSDESISDLVHYLDYIYEEYMAEDPVTQQIIANVESTAPGTPENDEAVRQMLIYSGIDPDEVKNGEGTLSDTPEARSQWEEEFNDALAAIDAANSEYDKLEADGFFNISNTPFNELGTVFGGYTFSKLSSSTRQYYEARARGEQPAAPVAGPNEKEYVLDLESGAHAYYRLHDNGYVITIPTEDLQITCDYSAMDSEILAAVRELQQAQLQLSRLQQAPFRVRDDSFVDEIMAVMDKVGAAMSKVSSHLEALKEVLDKFVEGERVVCNERIANIQAATYEGWNKYWSANSKWLNNDNFKKMQGKAAVALERIKGLRQAEQYLKNLAEGLGKVGKVLNVVALISDGHDIIETGSKLIELYYSIPDPCKNDQAAADAIASSIKGWGAARLTQKGVSFVTNAMSVAAAIVGVASTPESGGLGTVAGILVSVALTATSYVGNAIVDNYWNRWLNDWQKQIDALKCDSVPCPNSKPLHFDANKDLAGVGSSGEGSSSSSGENACGGECNKGRNTKEGSEEGGCPGPPPPPPPGTTPILDPSGYVYEAVGSNRVAQALATVYYKELYEDMYGDSHERTALWDAERFDQVNPMLTDENGEYGWDVPAGMWQVRVVKDGYLETYSDWLPVPPPQLDVNLAMEQPTAPVVQRVVATEQGIDLAFDKYMKPAHLTTENIFLTRNGQKLDGTLQLMDAEPTPDSLNTFARRLHFEPEQPLKLNDKVRLTVKAGVESYANVGMVADFTQEFDVEQRVSQLVADSVVGILHGDSYTLTLHALPASAAKGRKVLASSLNPAIAAIASNGSSEESTELTLNDQGQATLSLKGNGYGTTAVRLTLADDPEVETLTVVGVRDDEGMMTRKPTSSRINGTEILYGSTVSLRCETPGATIYYTLDGSCPCDNPQRLTYRGPIVVLSDITLKAVATAPGYAESDVATFTYKVRRDAEDISHLAADSVNAPVYDLQGRLVMKGKSATSTLKPGLYIKAGRKMVVR